MSGQVFGPGIYFDAGKDARIGEDFKKGRAVRLLLAEGLVIKNHAADALSETGRGEDQFPIRAPGFHRLRNAQLREALIAGGVAFIHGQKAFAADDQSLRGIC